jgi:hypothetical protein
VAAPEYVPAKAIDDTRVYTSPPRRPEPWRQDRPAELLHGQPRGDRLGSPGPDQGYALTLAERFRDRLALRPGEHEDDAIAGCLAVALKRASLFGRAPVIHDLTVAFSLFGFLDEHADDEVVAVRRQLFEEVADAHHYVHQREIADIVAERTLRLPPSEITGRSGPALLELLDLPAP